MTSLRDKNGYLIIPGYDETINLVGPSWSVKHPERFWGYVTKVMYGGVLGFKYKTENGEIATMEVPYEILDAMKGHFILVSKNSDDSYKVYKLICNPDPK
jgi:hypothetical protein